MKNALIGAGGFAMEIRANMKDFAMPCFVDKEYWTLNNGPIYPMEDPDPLHP